MEAPMIEKARRFAEMAHKGQVRKYNGQPYFTHPERVARRLEGLGYGPEMVAAGYLHDVVEDCGVKIEEIRVVFGDKVADLVSGLTNPSKGMKASRAVPLGAVRRTTVPLGLPMLAVLIVRPSRPVRGVDCDIVAVD